MEKYYKLESIRKQKGISQDEIAKYLGVSKPFYSQLENRKKRLSYKNAFLISKYLGMKPDDIFLEETRKYSDDKMLK